MGITRRVEKKLMHSGTVLGRPAKEGESPVRDMDQSL